ncbi:MULTISPECIES: poly(3-hydroxybutyrate) depolymerase [unclassified Oceanobacter]|uniref:extracellular catalytic domain type 2 short-chain-length polyhydroxyalkanoate depolymerase n=1 Tax=unclassified Oceanobacter TaxID=2620260 RepID=UPI0027328A51|nr:MULTISPECIES: poly(3-hydroxybutyrate) depolymerase [unclassified Oceanobacter]MDP2609370.1 poly(3-hydroxybutyrate) depolymerase [Oceanobacter sp. 1_MG-2023]MDP2612753.1 poly(3-hydroxybutyrate) depolymerase [Oceanobacter sp. 2_MG-2023]
MFPLVRYTALIVCLAALNSGCSRDDASDPAAAAADTAAGSGISALASYNADIQQTSVSGLSSGAFMASQLYMAHSDIMVGIGVIAGGPYLCSRSWPMAAPALTATTTCMTPQSELLRPNVSRLVGLTRELEQQGRIDAVINLQDDHLYLFSGRSDDTVISRVVDATRDYFVQLGVPAQQILYNDQINAGHAILTNNSDDTDCALTRTPFINNCQFMQSTRILSYLYMDAIPPAPEVSGELLAFDQRPFLVGERTSMAETGYVYVPQYCRQNSRCRIHVALHGCKQSYDEIGDAYIRTTGYNQMADSNRLIVLYPQVNVSDFAPLNPLGCWDYWGYSSEDLIDADFYSKKAPQIQAIYAMIQQLARG